MENILIFIFFAVLIAVAFGLGMVIKKLEELKKGASEDQSFQMLNQNLQGMHQRIDQMAHSLINELGQVKEMGRRMQDLQDFLRTPKLRGNLGEQVLKDMLAQVLPKDFYALPYQFRNGAWADGVIKIEAGLIPIDSKLPLENFNRLVRADSIDRPSYQKAFSRDLKKHIDDIARKYILPSEGTVDFALMYLASENVFYEIITQLPEIEDFARQRKVILVSPASFYHLLRAIMIGLEGKRISQASQRIMRALAAIQQENQKFGQGLGVLSRHLTNAKVSLDSVSSRYSELSAKIDSVKLLEENKEENKIGEIGEE